MAEAFRRSWPEPPPGFAVPRDGGQALQQEADELNPRHDGFHVHR